MALHVCSAVLAVPMLWVVGWPSDASYPHLLASILLHGVYIYILSKVYTHSAFCSAYIVMRGMAPLFVMLISLLALGESFDTRALAGLLCLSLGILFLLRTYATPQAQLFATLKGSHLQFALLNAVVIAAYTVVDGAGARLSGNPMAYVLASAVFEPILVYLLAYRHQTRALWLFSKHNAGLIVLGSSISITGTRRRSAHENAKSCCLPVMQALPAEHCTPASSSRMKSSTNRRHRSNVTDPSSTPPAVPSEMVGVSSASTIFPASTDWYITHEFRG